MLATPARNPAGKSAPSHREPKAVKQQGQHNTVRKYQRLVIVCCVMMGMFPLLAPCAAIAAMYFAAKADEVRRRERGGRAR